MMNRFLIALLLIAVGAASSYAGSVTQMTGPTGTNPANFPAAIPDYNIIINNLNAAISPGSTATGAALTNTGIFTGGSFQLTSSSKTGSMTLGTIQPGTAGLATLSSLTVKFFINFVDSVGNQAYIPVWE